MAKVVSTGRPQGAQGQATAIKIAQIARWKIAGVSIKTMAELLQMSPQGVSSIMQTQDYKDYEAGILNGHLTAMDKALEGRVEAIRKEAKVAVPAALRCLVDVVTQRQDLRSALAAAKEILDRDPDRTLVPAAEESVAPGLPEEVLNQAAEEGNKITASLNQAKPEVVN